MSTPPVTGAGRTADPRSAGHSWARVLNTLITRQELEHSSAEWAMNEVMTGQASPAQLAAFAVLLRAKGETPGELDGLVTAMLARATPIVVPGPAVDVVGTGGDRAQTVNISTMAALVTAGAGRRVVKHGNRAASSASGTADVLEELGVVIDLPPTGVAACVERVGIGFCFAPVFHPGMRHAGAVRRELGVPTIFNFLGPLTNPARPAAAAVGCADQRMAPVMAAVLARRGDRAMVFRGEDGLDELTTTTASQVWVAGPGGVSEHRLDPTRLGIAAAPPEALRGGGPSENATVVRDLAAGRLGPVRDAVVLNAAAAIAAFDSAAIATFDAAATAAYDAGVDPAADGPLEDRIAAGLEIASAAIDSGAVQAVLDHWIAVSTELRPG